MGSILIDPEDLANDLVESDLNPTIFDVNTKDMKLAKNVIDWVSNDHYLKLTPFARQFEILTTLFEDYCPWCSDTELLKDCWGQSLEYLHNKIALLHHGVCPHCKRNKVDFRKDALISDYQELVGVAGQRCLHPDTKILLFNGDSVPISRIEAGTWLMPGEGDVRVPTIVKEVIGSVQPGYFKLWFQGLTEPVICSDQHLWLTPEKIVNGIAMKFRETPTSELKVGYKIKACDLAQYQIIAKIEKVKRPCNFIDLETQGHKTFRGANGLIMHNSGKTAIAAMISTYVTHQYLCVDGLPYEYLGLAPTTIRATFVATSKSQAEETLWQNYLDMFDNCKWFHDYIEVLQNEEEKTGNEIYKRLIGSITFYNKAIKLTFEANNPSKLRGRTRFLASLDELGWFLSGEEYKESGQEAYSAMNNSLRTIRSSGAEKIRQGYNDPLRGWMINISSPAAEDDPIMPLLEASKIQKKVYGFHFATWEMNPTIKKEDLNDELLNNPGKFYRDFGAIPPSASDAFIGQPESIDLIMGERENAIKYDFQRTVKNAGTSQYHYVSLRIIKMTPHKVDYPRILTIDAGETDNSYGISIVYYDFEKEKTVAEVLIEIEPLVTPDGKVVAVSFEKAVESLKKFVVPFNIVFMVADRWNSTSTIEQMREEKGKFEKVDAWKQTPKMPDFKLFRARIFNGEAELPKADAESHVKHPDVSTPVSRCAMQAKTVKDAGRTILKPAWGSDDVFRAWLLGDIVANEKKTELKKIWKIQKNRARRKVRVGYAGKEPLGRRLVSPGTGYSSKTSRSGRVTTGSNRSGYGAAIRIKLPDKK